MCIVILYVNIHYSSFSYGLKDDLLLNCACCLQIFTPFSSLSFNSNCMTAVIRAITELSIKLRFNDRFGCPHNAMCVCVMII